MARKSGIDVCGCFIVGYPTETEDDILMMIEYAKAMRWEEYA
jgi:radical SAM superfamily enzyme YgiQ (UPF0313 family)